MSFFNSAITILSSLVTELRVELGAQDLSIFY